MDLLGNIKVDFDLKASFAKSVSLPLRAIKKPRKAPEESKQAEHPQILIIVIRN